MSWTANILLKSGNFISIENLQSVDTKSIIDSSIEKITDFKSFHLPKGQLSFVGENKVVSIHSNEIKYVDLSMND